jgi:hypothetical protein
MKKILCPLLVVNIFFLSMASCKTQDIIKYVYSDGNNNSYIIRKTELEYKPVTPMESSSGVYSGGNPRTIDLTQSEYDKIVAVLNKAIEDKSMHIDQRIMMSGLISVENQSGKQTYILGARSNSKAEIEAILKELLEKK